MTPITKTELTSDNFPRLFLENAWRLTLISSWVLIKVLVRGETRRQKNYSVRVDFLDIHISTIKKWQYNVHPISLCQPVYTKTKSRLINGKRCTDVFHFFSLERRWSIHSFRYGCLVTTSSLSSPLPFAHIRGHLGTGNSLDVTGGIGIINLEFPHHWANGFPVP